MAYLDSERDAALHGVRAALCRRTERPTTFGWGPRFLHSTGQYHKGGPPQGVFLQITCDEADDVEIPDRPFTFGTLITAQAAGDAAVLADHGRPVLRLHLTDPAPASRPWWSCCDDGRQTGTACDRTRCASPQDRRLPRIAGPCGLVIFGVTGDLARKKLMPAVYDLANRGLLPPGFALVGFARRDWADQDFAQIVHDAVKEHARTPFREEVWQQLAEGFRFVPGDFSDDVAFDQLRETIEELDRERGTGGNHAFYLSIPPRFFPDVVGSSRSTGSPRTTPAAWRRVVVEKPFGHDLKSARELNAIVSEVFPPESVFRIDHYLGKETVQNILALRFANQLFEPVWNANYVDHVQITMAEDIGIGGRAGYYDGIGAARDVIQNHLLQLMALIAMEEPVSFDAQSLRLEKQKILRSRPAPDAARPAHLPRPVRRRLGGRREGQGLPRGGGHPVGRRRPRRSPRSSSRSTPGAGPACRSTCAPASGSGAGSPRSRWCSSGRRTCRSPRPRPRSSARTRWSSGSSPTRASPCASASKVPGTAMEIRDVNMDFAYGGAFVESSPEAYERLILDVLLGDPPLFPQHEEVELSWQILDPILEYWAEHGKPDTYESGTWGPQSADEMLARDGRAWRRP